MKQKNFLKIAMLIVFAIISNFSYGQILTEQFDDDSKFTKSQSFFSDGTSDYFGILDPVDGTTNNFGIGSAPSGVANYNNFTGNYLVGEDLNGDGYDNTQTLTWENLNITNYTDLSISVDLGANTAKFDSGEGITLSINIDDSGYVDIIDFKSSATNSILTNGSQILNFTLQTITENIAGTGNSMDLKLSIKAEAGDEEFAVDELTINGTVSSTDPTVTFDAETSAFNETDVDITADIPVTLSNFAAGVTITPTVNGSSTADPADYTIDLTPLTFSADGTLNIPLTIHDDADFIDETIIIDFTITSGTADLDTSQHTVMITDDEVAPSIGFDTATSSETETDATFNVLIPVTVSDYSGTQIDVSIAASGTADVADYTLNTASLTFTADGSQNISLDINDDADTDSETVILTITETSAVTGLVISQAIHTITIADDEAPATYSGVGTFVKITDVSEIVDSGYYVLVDETDELFAMNNTHNGTILNKTDVTPVSNTLTNPDVSIVWEIKTDGSGKTIFNNTTAKYVSYTGSSNNVQVVDAVTADNQRWTITHETDEFWITNLAVTNRRLQYNSGAPRFVCYTGSQRDISIYKLLTSTTWTGNADTDWAKAGNWSNGAPTISSNAIIPEVATAPIISATTGSLTYNLTITETDGLTINNGGSLIVAGTSSGNVTYNRTLTYDADKTKAWYLVSSPVNGEIMTDMITNNTFATSGANIGFAPYDNSHVDSNDRWAYFGSGATDALVNGKGYTAKLGAAGDLSFTGTLNTGDIAIGLTKGSNNFNFIGNPYTAFIDNGTFLTANTDELEHEEVYIWNQATNQYDTKVSGDPFKIAPGQGFFVEAKTTNDITFTTALQSNEASDTFQKSTARPEVQLFMDNGDTSRYLKVYYIDGSTTGFDNGFDGKLFGGVPQPFALYTHLVSDSKGENFQIQSLPNSDLESMVIPVGITADAGKEIIFTAEALNLPSELNVYLEDRQTNSYTRLDEANANYKVSLTEELNGVGRFFLHTSAKSILNIDTIALENISIYKTSNSNLRIVGLSQGKSNVKLFNIFGKQVLNSTFNSTDVQDISLPNLATGIYIVQLETEVGKLNKKITLE